VQGRIRGRAQAARRRRTGGGEVGHPLTTAKRSDRARESRAAESRAPWERVTTVLVYAALLIYSTFPYSDFDWGWHYRYGEYFFTHGRVLRHDIFSWTMPGYAWVNHSWLFDPLLYVIYTRFSLIGLSIAGALASVLTFYLSVRRAHPTYWQTAILAVFYAALTKDIMMQGLRTQVVGLLLLALLGDLLARQREGRNWPQWVLPGLFCIWANLHGSFLLGLVVFGAYVAWDAALAQVRGSALSRRWFMFAGSFLASIAATLVNPFTYGVYVEARRHFGNPHLTYVVEWMAPNFSELVGMAFVAYTLVVAYGFFTRRSLADVPHILIAAGTFYMAATTRRHVAVFVVLTLPVVASVIAGLRFRVVGVARTSAALAVMIVTFGLVVFDRRAAYHDVLHSSMRTYCYYGPHCSEGLTEFLLQHPPVGRGFTFYDWGGHLIGRGVQAKLYIDGRMHLWERSDYQPMAEYRAIYVLNDMDAFRRHKFDWILVPRESDFVKNLVAAVSPSTGVRESDLWIIAYQDDRVFYAVRRKDVN
jgi:hypothetical protein